jgi:hypothetical protein
LPIKFAGETQDSRFNHYHAHVGMFALASLVAASLTTTSNVIADEIADCRAERSIVDMLRFFGVLLAQVRIIS